MSEVMAIAFCRQKLLGHSFGQPVGSFHAVLLGNFWGGEFLRVIVAGTGLVVGVPDAEKFFMSPWGCVRPDFLKDLAYKAV